MNPKLRFVLNHEFRMALHFYQTQIAKPLRSGIYFAFLCVFLRGDNGVSVFHFAPPSPTLSHMALFAVSPAARHTNSKQASLNTKSCVHTCLTGQFLDDTPSPGMVRSCAVQDHRGIHSFLPLRVQNAAIPHQRLILASHLQDRDTEIILAA